MTSLSWCPFKFRINSKLLRMNYKVFHVMDLPIHQAHPQPLCYPHTGTPAWYPATKLNCPSTLLFPTFMPWACFPLYQKVLILFPSSHCIHSALPVLWRHYLSDLPKADSHSFFHANLGISVQSFCIAFIIVSIHVLPFCLRRQWDLQSHKIGFIHLYLPKSQLILTGVRMRHPKLWCCGMRIV